MRDRFHASLNTPLLTGILRYCGNTQARTMPFIHWTTMNPGLSMTLFLSAAPCNRSTLSHLVYIVQTNANLMTCPLRWVLSPAIGTMSCDFSKLTSSMSLSHPFYLSRIRFSSYRFESTMRCVIASHSVFHTCSSIRDAFPSDWLYLTRAYSSRVSCWFNA